MGGNVSSRKMNLDRKRSVARDVKKILFCRNRNFGGREDVNGALKILSMVHCHPVRKNRLSREIRQLKVSLQNILLVGFFVSVTTTVEI